MKDVKGHRVHIDSFSVMEVVVEWCNPPGTGNADCYGDTYRFRPPARIEIKDDVLTVVPNQSDFWAPGIYLFRHVRYIRVRGRSERRGWIIAGTAVAAGIAAFAATSMVMQRADDPNRDPHGYAVILLPFFAGSAAAGLSLLFTLTLTGDHLGNVQE